MKIAAYLALALALILGGWSAIDYHQNERVKQIVVLELEATIVAPDSGMGGHAHRDLDEVLVGERYDGAVATLAALILIGSVALFSKSKRTLA